VSDYTLHAEAALKGYAKRFGQTYLTENNALDIVSIAIPDAKRETVRKLLENKVGLSIPDTGHRSIGTNTTLLALQADQYFLISDGHRDAPAAALKTLLGDAAYLSDQTDSWVVLDIQGPESHLALERICPIDISADVFQSHHVARTSMEHLNVIVHRIDNGFRLLSARSSANSFLHAITESLHNVS